MTGHALRSPIDITANRVRVLPTVLYVIGSSTPRGKSKPGGTLMEDRNAHRVHFVTGRTLRA